MKILGIDFTSRPSPRKPLTCLEAQLEDHTLQALGLSEWTDFTEFEAALQEPGPWIAGIDFPFGQARRFIETVGWPVTWQDYVAHARGLGREGFRTALDEYRATRSPGDKEHRRETDVVAGSISPQKLYGTPVAVMFFEGAYRLLQAGVTIPSLQSGDPQRIVVEAYPGLLARRLVGRRSYKQDAKRRQTAAQHAARRELLDKINSGALALHYGLQVSAPIDLADDPGGDALDALLCAIQAAWAWTQRDARFGAPEPCDRLEGWIADPALVG